MGYTLPGPKRLFPCGLAKLLPAHRSDVAAHRIEAQFHRLVHCTPVMAIGSRNHHACMTQPPCTNASPPTRPPTHKTPERVHARSYKSPIPSSPLAPRRGLYKRRRQYRLVPPRARARVHNDRLRTPRRGRTDRSMAPASTTATATFAAAAARAICVLLLLLVAVVGWRAGARAGGRRSGRGDRPGGWRRRRRRQQQRHGRPRERRRRQQQRHRAREGRRRRPRPWRRRRRRRAEQAGEQHRLPDLRGDVPGEVPRQQPLPVGRMLPALQVRQLQRLVHQRLT